MKSKYPFTLIAVMFVFCMTTIMSSVVDARGRGGGGGFSRGGPAAGGGFSSRPAARQPARQAPRQETRRVQPDDHDRDRGDRQDYRDDAREDRQDYQDDAREDRQDYLDDEWDDHHHDYHGGAAFVTGVAVGAAASSNYVTSAPCNTTVVVSGLTYYHCGSTWYSRGNEGGEVVYIMSHHRQGIDEKCSFLVTYSRENDYGAKSNYRRLFRPVIDRTNGVQQST